MVRTIPPSRFAQLIEVATATFIHTGYRQTQMADVAEALGVGKGTLYGYVESKEALFDAALRFADRPADVPPPAALPVKTPEPGTTLKFVRDRLTAGTAEMTLVRVARGAIVIEDAAQELRAVLEDLYDRLSASRYAIKLVDRCATDYPELAALWFGEGRWAQHQLLMLLVQRRIADGSYRACENVAVAARTMIETIAFWALHRHFDASPQPVDDTEARRVVIDLLSRGLLEVRQ